MLTKIFGKPSRLLQTMQFRSFSGSYDSSKILIETAQLKTLLSQKDQKLNILHAFFDLNEKAEGNPDDPLAIQEKYKGIMSAHPGHIPGAKAFPLLAYCDTTTPYNLTRATEEQFQRIAKALDLRITDTFICYDSGLLSPQSKLAWTLKGFGAKNVHVLNGTLLKWIKEGGELSTEYSADFQRKSAATDADYKFKFNSDMFEDYEQMKVVIDKLQSSTGKRELTIIDAKPRDEPGVPEHIKVPFETLYNEDSTLKSDKDLMELLKVEAGINDASNDKVISTCKMGFTASNLCIALTKLGNKNVTLYDGAYQEWASKQAA